MSDNDSIDAQPYHPAAPVSDGEGGTCFQVGMTFECIEREMLLKTLTHHGNNKSQAARALGITTKTVYNRLQRYRAQGLIGDELFDEHEDAD